MNEGTEEQLCPTDEQLDVLSDWIRNLADGEEDGSRQQFVLLDTASRIHRKEPWNG